MLSTLLSHIHQTTKHKLPDFDLIARHAIVNGLEGRQELLLALEVGHFSLRQELYGKLFQRVDCVHGYLKVRVAARLSK
jgi:hypothetical protein